jgi:acetyltransferase
MGLLRASIRLNTSFVSGLPPAGRLALVSQSGAVCAALLDFAVTAGIGFSTVVSLGAAADLDFGEILDFLIGDIQTESILLYVEGIHDARRFLSALRAAARTKPVVVLKTGRHLTGSRAASSHSGALVGDDAVFAAALRRSGTVRVETYTQLFAAARMLATRRIPRGNRLAIVTNGGGPGVMAADRASDDHVQLASLEPATIEALSKALPPHWSRGNPVDVAGDAPPDRIAYAVQQVLGDANVDGLLVLNTPQLVAPPEEAAAAVVEAVKGSNKPVLASWLGRITQAPSHAVFDAGGVPHFYTPENAVDAFSYLAAYRANQQLLLEVPPPLETSAEPDYAAAEALRQKLVAEGRTVMSEDESKALVKAFGVNVPDTRIARTAEEALVVARKIGYPVALKVLSPDVSHKSDVHGVQLGLRNGRMVGAAFRYIAEELARLQPDARFSGVLVQKMVMMPRAREVLVGIANDAVFGPVITFGSGGVAVDAIADTAVMLPPLNRSLALDLVSRPRIHRLLQAFRDYPAANIDALAETLLKVSDIACELPWVRELDLNPVLVDEEQAIAVDARVVIDPAREARPQRYRHMAIHPYPSELESTLTLRDGSEMRVRPIRPEDATMERAFVASLSEQTRYMRFQHHLPELTPQMLARFTQIDYDRELALVALEGSGEDERIRGVARYVANPNVISAEFAIVVGDDMQGKGLGFALMTKLLAAAREVGYRYIEGSVLTGNSGMLRLMAALGFRVERDENDSGVVRVVKDLD